MKRRLLNMGAAAILCALCSLVWFPLLMMAGNSLMSAGELLERYPAVFGAGSGRVQWALLPDYPTAKPYVELLLDSPGFYVMFWNSWLQTGASVAGQLVAAAPAAWALARFSFPGRRWIFPLYVTLMLLPFQAVMAPGYLVLDKLRLLDTHPAVIFPAVFSAFPVFILAQFFKTVPASLVEAAKLEGAGEFSAFLKIGVPLGMPGITAVAILGFLEGWNAIEAPMTYLKDKTLWPLSLYLPQITADKAGAAWAASVVTMLPPVLLFLTGQSFLEKGIAVSGIKE